MYPASVILSTSDDGATWSLVEYHSAAGIGGVSFTDTLHGFGVIAGARFETQNGGLTWNYACCWGIGWPQEDLQFIDSEFGATAGEFGTSFRTEDGGNSWINQSPGGEYHHWGIAFSDRSHGLMVGQGYSPPFFGIIYRTTNGGSSWTVQWNGENDLFDVTAINSDTAIAIGEGGLILRTSDGGTTWESRASGTTDLLNAVSFVDAHLGIVGGVQGTLLQTTDAGLTWQTIPVPTGTTILGLWLADANRWTLIGEDGMILTTSTGGTGIIPPQPPTLVYPPDDEFVTSTHPSLHWTSDGRAASYSLQVSRSRFFQSFAANVSGYVDTSFAVSGLDEDETYFWRVSLLDNIGRSGWSRMRSFTTTMDVPNQVDLISPEDGALLTSDSVVFIWHRSPFEADRYWLEISEDSLFTSPQVDSTLADTITSTSDLNKSQDYWWKVRAHDLFGWGEFSEVWSFSVLMTGVEDKQDIPREFSLSQNYPNPFNPSTRITYGLPKKVDVRLELFDLLGQRVALLVDEEEDMGWHGVLLQTSRLGSGVYFYRLQAGTFVDTRRLMVLK